MTPVFGVTFSTLLLNEGGQIAPAQIVAALALVSTGIYTINKPEKKA